MQRHVYTLSISRRGSELPMIEVLLLLGGHKTHSLQRKDVLRHTKDVFLVERRILCKQKNTISSEKRHIPRGKNTYSMRAMLDARERLACSGSFE